MLHSLGLFPLPQLTPPARVPVCFHLHFPINPLLSGSSSRAPLKPLLPVSLLHAGFLLSTETVPSMIPWWAFHVMPALSTSKCSSLSLSHHTLLDLFPLGGHFFLGSSMHLSSCNYP